MKAIPITTPGFWKKEPRVAKNSPTRLLWVSTGPSLAGRGSIMLCQQLKARNSPATKNSVRDQATGMLPELLTNVTAVSLFSLGSSWMTAMAGWFQLVELKTKRSPSLRLKPLSLLPTPMYSIPRSFRPKLTATSWPAGGALDNDRSEEHTSELQSLR